MFKRYVASVYSKCFIYFSNICYKCVYLDVAYVSSVFRCFYKCFKRTFEVFQMYVSSVSSVFTHMLQMFYLDVSKTNQVLLLGTHLSWQASEQSK
jgi:hypothetical protein